MNIWKDRKNQNWLVRRICKYVFLLFDTAIHLTHKESQNTPEIDDN